MARQDTPGRGGEAPLTGVRVLLAEDDPANRLLISAFLRKAGALVLLVANGRDAVQAARRGHWDVILMDMQMPDMDGYEATRLIRLEGLAVPVVALTAHSTAADRQRCLAGGCAEYLTKPVDRPALIETVARMARPPDESDPAQPARSASPPAGGEAIHSPLADDPDLAGILDKFVAGLPQRVEAMRQALLSGSYERLGAMAHQLKGAGGSYGYPQLTDAAGAVMKAAGAGDVEGAGLAWSHIAKMCEAIVRALPAPVPSDEVQP